MMRFFPLTLFVACLLFQPFARADQLVFDNGDTLNGRALDVQEGIIYFQTDNFGIIRVPEDQATVESSEVNGIFTHEPTAAVITEAEAEAAGVKIPKPPAASEVAEAEAQLEETEETLLLDNPIYRFFARYNPLTDWKSKISIGYIWETGETEKEDWSFRFTTEREKAPWQIRLGYQWDYATQKSGDGERNVTEDFLSSSARIRRDLGSRYFAQSNTRYLNDGIKEIQHEISQSVGLGYRYFTGERLKGAVTPSLNARYRSFSDDADLAATDDEHLEGWDYFFTIYQELDYTINERMSFEEEAEVSFNINDFSAKSYRLSAKVVNRITDKLTLDLAYIYAYDVDVGAGIDKDEQRIIGLLGVEF